MSFELSIYTECCLLTNTDLNSQRIRQLLERRFRSNSQRTSFDFKSFLPEQPSTNAKVSRSFLRFQPKIQFTDDSEENLSSDSDGSSFEEEEEEEIEREISTNDDDYYKELADWEPSNFQPMNETDEDDEEVENIPESVMTEMDAEVDQMDYSSVQDTPTSQVEDLLVTFIHRPVKNEPISYHDNVFHNLPQLDGHIDLSPNASSSTQLNHPGQEKDLNDVIARFRGKSFEPRKAIQLYRTPPTQDRTRSNNRVENKPINLTPKRSDPSPLKTNQIKRQSMKEGKQTKKPKSQLFNSLMKSNEDAIRESDIRLSSNQMKNQKSSLISSNTNKQPDRTKISSQQRSNFATSTKHKHISETQRYASQSKEKSASHHMKLAQKKLNYFQEHQQLVSPILNTSNSKFSSMKPSKLKENIKAFSSPSETIDALARRLDFTSKAPPLSNHNQQVKKKIKQPKRLNSKESNHSSRIKQKSSSKPGIRKRTEDNVVNKQRSESVVKTTSSTEKRSSDYFDGCIVLDDEEEKEANDNHTEDDDIQEIEQQRYSVAYDIRAREKDLDHIIHSPVMHIKWLFNLEYLLLDHISICHEKNIRPLNKIYENSVIIKCDHPTISSIYHIDPAFISIVIINFIKVFLLRNSFNDQQEFAFVQFGITSHLRYLLIELPTYNHNEEKDFNDDCLKCHRYSLLINILFDLLFDLIEYDLCEINTKNKYRSSLIEDDYFTRFLHSKPMKKNPFYRIKLIIYFIELIGIHMNKCQNKKQFQFNTSENKLFRSIEDFIRHIIGHINSSIYERISICFNVMELCLLFVNEKQIRMKEMSLLLAELCTDNLTYSNLFLFDENLFVDIRLLLTNELIWKKFGLKLTSINDINAFFRQIQGILSSEESIDESALLLVRSLFSAYADLIIEIKAIPSMYSNYMQQITLILRNQVESIFHKLLEIPSANSDSFKRTLMLCHLLKCKWNKL